MALVLGTAATQDSSAFASASQGTKADSAVQTIQAGSGIVVDATNPQMPIVSATSPLSSDLPVSTNVGTAYSITNSAPITTLYGGLAQWWLPNITNSGPATLDIDGLGNVAIHINGAALIGNELQPGVLALCVYHPTTTSLDLVITPKLPIYTTATGTNTLSATLNGVTSLYDGLEIDLKFAATNTTTITINLNAAGAKNCYLSDGSSPIIAGQCPANGIGKFIYNSSLNSGAGGFTFLNPAVVTGTFTVTATGFTATISGTATWTIVNKIVYLTLPALSGTSNATTLTLTGIPADIQPTTFQQCLITAYDNTSAGPSSLVASNSSTWTWFKNFVNAWTSSGTKGVPGIITIIYRMF